jgi:predicted acyltransferase
VTTASSQRLISLDAFRGATVAGMMLVNNPGTWSAIYPQLAHAPWHGWTFTDWIFPFFLFAVGAAMVFSFAKRKESGASKSDLYKRVAVRSFKIFLWGLFLNAFPFGLLFDHQFSVATLRIPGVLQRIAVCFLVVGFIYLNTTWRQQLWIVVGLLAVYWAALTVIPVPGYGPGVLEPTGNLAWFIDSNLLAGHTWSGAPAKGFDPEGIISTLGAIATTLCGVLCGEWLRAARTKEEKTVWMFVGGNALLLLGAVCDIWMPINKNLWTSSYVMLMAGWSLICLATFYWLIDVKGWSAWSKPFVMFGMNAIAAFVFSGIIGRIIGLWKVGKPDGTLTSLKNYLYENFYLAVASPTNASLLFAITFMLMMLVIMYVMWRRKWFWKV